MRIIAAFIAFLEVFLYSVGIFSAGSDVSYTSSNYSAPKIRNEMKLVENGGSSFSIVIPEKSDATLKTAAKELQTYIKKISGATLGIINEAEFPDSENGIFLGLTACSKAALGKEIKSLKDDGFVIFSQENRLIISGKDSRGTLYGVYTLLEEYFGVRWFTPTLEKVPENSDLIIDNSIKRTVEPSFSIRRNDSLGTNDAYRARTKMNVSFWNEATEYGGALTYVLWDVTLDKLVPDELFKEHPDYFATTEDGAHTYDHICLSNPEVLEVAVKNAREAILNCETDAKYIHIGQKDNTNYCKCKKCTALYEKYGSVCAPTLIFTNKFADALDDEFPDFTFTFYAYNETDAPPTDLSLKCNDNVIPVLCGLHKACRNHPLTECGAVDGDESFLNLYGSPEPVIAENFKNWTKVAKRTYIYDYTINFINSAQFFSNFETMQSTMQYMRDIGITGYVYNCGDTHIAAFNELRNYLLCKLQWNVDCDVEYHMADFMNAYYGEAAAPYIKEIIDIQTAQIKATAHAFDFDWHYQSGFYPIYTIFRLDSLWKKALNANITKEQRFNVEVANLSWEYFKANQLLGEYFFLNPRRLKENEELYDAFISHGITEVTSFGKIPEKENINFMNRPYTWEE